MVNYALIDFKRQKSGNTPPTMNMMAWSQANVPYNQAKR